jgi:predicted HTH transcriptional regulator
MPKMFPKKLDEEFVNLLLKEEEGLKLEYKQQISSQEKIAKTLSAMSNTAGGMILIGISDQRKIIGIDPEEERYMIAAANEHYFVPKANLDLHVISIDPENLH